MKSKGVAFTAPGQYIRHPLDIARLGDVDVVVFPDGQGSALIHGDIDDGALVRMQSACQYGEIYGSRECDCRDQLDGALDAIGDAGAGVLIHLLAHEGRGAGLRAKATAYWLRVTKGLNTFESYDAQDLEPDRRTYDVATTFIRDELNLSWIHLLTNNPDKVNAVKEAGIDVRQTPHIYRRPESAEYMQVKAEHGHLL